MWFVERRCDYRVAWQRSLCVHSPLQTKLWLLGMRLLVKDHFMVHCWNVFGRLSSASGPHEEGLLKDFPLLLNGLSQVFFVAFLKRGLLEMISYFLAANPRFPQDLQIPQEG